MKSLNEKAKVKNETPVKVIIQDLPSSGCPIGIEELGNSTWNLLHTLAENFPEYPNEREQSQLGDFVKLLATLYPCQHCRVSAH